MLLAAVRRKMESRCFPSTIVIKLCARSDMLAKYFQKNWCPLVLHGTQDNDRRTRGASRTRIIYLNMSAVAGILAKAALKYRGQTLTPMLRWRRVTECGASGLFQQARLRAGANSTATAGPAWLHVWPPAPCVVCSTPHPEDMYSIQDTWWEGAHLIA